MTNDFACLQIMLRSVAQADDSFAEVRSRTRSGDRKNVYSKKLNLDGLRRRIAVEQAPCGAPRLLPSPCLEILNFYPSTYTISIDCFDLGLKIQIKQNNILDILTYNKNMRRN